MKLFFLFAGLIAAPAIYLAQIPSAEGGTTQVKNEGWPLQLRFELGGGRISAQLKDADGERAGDVRNPARGYVFGLTATTEERSRYSGLFSLHYLRRGYDVDVVATVQELEESLQADGLDVTLNNVLGFAEERTNWIEGQASLRSRLGKHFFVQGGLYSGVLLGGSIYRNYWWDMTSRDPSSDAEVTVGVYANNIMDVVTINGELNEERFEALIEIYGENVAVRRQFSTGLTFELGTQVAGGELTLGYRHSVSNLLPRLTDTDPAEQLFGSQQFISLRFGIFLN